MAVLSSQEISSFLETHSRWKLDSEKLIRDWSFDNFIQTMAFVNRVAELAESSNHHPDIDIRYNKVWLSLVSHDAGGITQRDLRMAAVIDNQFG
jgi:4a-hydroxytetrahydrobiopterin dehydratase